MMTPATVALLSLLAFAHAADEACMATAVGRALSPDEQRAYAEEGYVIVRSMFTSEEVAVLVRTIESDPSIAANVMPMVDASGRTSKVTLWNRAGNNTYGHFARGRRWVGAATALIGEAPYHFHTKVMLKVGRSDQGHAQGRIRSDRRERPRGRGRRRRLPRPREECQAAWGRGVVSVCGSK